MIPTREQILDLIKGLEDDGIHEETPEWIQTLSDAEVAQLGANVFRLALLGLLVHPETSASTQADLDLEEGKLENAKHILLEVRMNALELEK